MNRDAVLRAEGLARAFGPTQALDNVSLAVHAGDVLAVLGPNGAGKTTLLNVLTGATRPQAGSVSIDGKVVEVSDPEWRSSIGVVSHQSGLYGHLTALENLRFFGDLHGLGDSLGRARVALEDVGLASHANQPVAGFSRGMAQRVAIARATLHDPRVLFFDEPFTGLDADAMADLHSLIESLKGHGRAVVLVTHRTPVAARHADHVLLLVRGRVAYQGSDFPRDESLQSFIQHRTEAA